MHTLTQDDLDKNPLLGVLGYKVGDDVSGPINPPPPPPITP